VASSPYDQLLVVQGFDTSGDQLKHKRTHHPIRSEIAGVDEKIAELEVVSAEISARKHELDREQKRLDDEVSLIDDKRAQIDAKLYNGSVTATKDLLALQDEAAMLLDRKNGIEDSELEIMESVEEVSTELEPVVTTIESLREARIVHESDLAAALDVIASEIETAEQNRTQAAALVPPDLLAHYNSLRADFEGVAVARLIGTTCDGCHMSLSAVAVDQIKKLPDDAVVTCDQCGRLLIR